MLKWIHKSFFSLLALYLLQNFRDLDLGISTSVPYYLPFPLFSSLSPCNFLAGLNDPNSIPPLNHSWTQYPAISETLSTPFQFDLRLFLFIYFYFILFISILSSRILQIYDFYRHLPFTIQWLLYVPPSFALHTSALLLRSLLTCYVWFSLQTQFTSLNDVTWQVLLTDTNCVLFKAGNGTVEISFFLKVLTNFTNIHNKILHAVTVLFWLTNRNIRLAAARVL